MMLKTPTQPAHDGLQPGRIWSLWDMLDKHALFFVQATGALTEFKFLCLSLEQANPLEPLTPNMRTLANSALHNLRRAYILSDMQDEIGPLDRLERSINPLPGHPQSTATAIGMEVRHLLPLVRDKLDAQYYFHVDGRDVPLYQAQEPFGSEVTEKFPKAVEDIQEAAKCLALQQSTACVFHLMRAMEVVVKRLGKRLGVKNVEKEWGKILSEIDNVIRAMPDAKEKDKRKKNRWSEARANLYHVKQAWRNETMHPKQTYTREQAHEVFAATRTFMSHLASLL